MKVNIECRTIILPASGLSTGTYFRYKIESREETQEEQSGVFLMTNMQGKAVNLYTGTIVTVLDLPYDIIKDVELRGWV